jgi:DNA polymerase-1
VAQFIAPESVMNHAATMDKETTKIEITSSEDSSDFFQTVKKEKTLIIRPVELLQSSLFADTPALVLGSDETSFVVSSSRLKEKKFVSELSSILSDKEIQKVGHGLKNVWHWARSHGFDLDGLHFDTEIAAYIASGAEGDYDLPSLAEERLNIMIPDSDEKALIEIDAIRRLKPILEKELKEKNLETFNNRFETPLIRVLANMETQGILIDRTYFKSLTDDFRKEKVRLENEMEKSAGESFNPASPQQLARVLFDVLKISSKGIKRGKTGISTAAAELEKLEGLHPIIAMVGEYREVAKLLSTYVEALPALADERGRVHTTYNQALTATGRLSSSNPNLQNIPIRTELGRKIRKGFIAKKGFRLLSCDYSQIELRVVAALADDKKMIEAFVHGLDIHTATAAAIWDIPLEKVTKDQRRSAKAINFGIIYGQGPVGLSKSAGISFDEAKRFISEYFHVYSGVHEYLEQTKALARARGYVETLFGRRRILPEINSPMPQFRSGAERMAINMPVQGTSADLIKLAMIEIHRVLSKISTETRMLLQVHDELVFEVPEDEVATVSEKLVDIMQSIEKIGVPIVVDAKQGKNWDEMEAVVIEPSPSLRRRG